MHAGTQSFQQHVNSPKEAIVRLLRSSLLLLLIAVSTSAAKADTITFEGLTDGTTVTNQFSNLLFLNATIATAGISLNEFEFPPHSGSNVVFDSDGSMSISFLVPVTSVSGFFTYGTQLTVTVFDASNNVLATLTSAFNNNEALSGDVGSHPNEFISFSVVSGISRISISGDPGGGSFTLDDLTFSTAAPVPEPASLSLLLGALGGLCVKNRLRRQR
jgi:hypothetical protein